MKMKYRYETNDGRKIVGRSLTRYVRCAPRKIRFVADEIRDKRVDEAYNILAYTMKPSAVPAVTKALKAAVDSAKDVHPEPESLVIGEAIVNDAPMLKRIRPAAMGRAVRIRKRQSHIFLGLTEE